MVDLAAGLALAEGVRARRAAPRRRWRAALSARGAGARGAGARMSDASVALRSSRRTAERPRTTRTRARRHGSQLTGRSLLVLGGFIAASLAALYYLLPQLAGLEDTWHRIEDGSPWWMLLALVFTVGMFVGYVMLFRGVFVRAPSARADRLARELPDHDGRARGVADLRGRRRRRARAHGLGAAARRACASGWSPTRRCRS